jgi:hypothetical protein
MTTDKETTHATPAMADLSERAIYSVLYEMRLAPRHQLKEAAKRVAALARRAAQPVAPSPQVAEGEDIAAKLKVANRCIVRLATENEDLRDAIAASRHAAGGEVMYQAQFDGEYGSSVWHDVTEAAYHTFVPKHRRIVYAAPVAARELDVEAERREYMAALYDCSVLLNMPKDAPLSQVPKYLDEWLTAARSAAQGPRPS